MTDPHDECGCQEYRELSRRGFVTAGLNVAALALPSGMPGVAPGGALGAVSQQFARRDRLDLHARRRRRALARRPVRRRRVLLGAPDHRHSSPPTPLRSSAGSPLDNFFMLPQGMAGLRPAYLANQLLIVHATGQSATNSRSHFEAERYLEAGKPADYGIATGWLARHLLTSAPVKPTAPLRGISLGWGGDAPHAHRGPQDAPHSAAGELPALRA
jgi:uncharacterized protein (DUF1501 family)